MTTARLTAVLIGAALLAGCGSAGAPASSSPTSTSSPTTAPSTAAPSAAALPEMLHFSGDVAGDMTSGPNPHGHTTNYPNPNGEFPEWTQCADYTFDYNAGHTANQYEAIVSGTIGAQRFALELVVDKD